MAYELDSRISKISADSCDAFEEFQQKQKEVWRILNNINSTTLQEEEEVTTALINKENTNESNPNSIQSIADIRKQKAKLLPSKQSPTPGTHTKTSHGEDVSSAGDIQTLLLQQKVYYSTVDNPAPSILCSNP